MVHCVVIHALVCRGFALPGKGPVLPFYYLTCYSFYLYVPLELFGDKAWFWLWVSSSSVKPVLSPFIIINCFLSIASLCGHNALITALVFWLWSALFPASRSYHLIINELILFGFIPIFTGGLGWAQKTNKPAKKIPV